MRLDHRSRRFVRAHPRVTDAALAAALLPLSLFVHDPHAASAPLAAPAVVAVALACAALTVRRRWPTPVLAVTTAAAGLVTVTNGQNLVVLTVIVALFTVALLSDRRSTATAWAASAATLTAASLIHLTSSGDFQSLSYIGWTGMAAAAGDALRSRRAYIAAVEERAARAEHSREEEARRRVVEERLRIARELHDVVAHRIAVINVQAGVASHLLSSSPHAAEEALGHVRAAARAVLDEVAGILNVLRQPDETTAPTAPAPTLAELDQLVASFSAAGLKVNWSLTGQPTDTGSAVGLVAYRLLQEALTNAHKHGTGTARMVVAYGPSTLTLSVDNPLPQRPAPTKTQPTPAEPGHGLTGMRKRAAAVGGALDAAPAADGLFHVQARLPLQPALVP